MFVTFVISIEISCLPLKQNDNPHDTSQHKDHTGWLIEGKMLAGGMMSTVETQGVAHQGCFTSIRM